MSTSDKIRSASDNSDDYELNGDQFCDHEMELYRSDRDNQDQILVEPKEPTATAAVMKRFKAFTSQHKLIVSGEYDQEVENLSTDDPEVYDYLNQMKQYISDLDAYERLKRSMRKKEADVIDRGFGTVRSAVDDQMKKSLDSIAVIMAEQLKKASGE